MASHQKMFIFPFSLFFLAVENKRKKERVPGHFALPLPSMVVVLPSSWQDHSNNLPLLRNCASNKLISSSGYLPRIDRIRRLGEGKTEWPDLKEKLKKYFWSLWFPPKGIGRYRGHLPANKPTRWGPLPELETAHPAQPKSKAAAAKASFFPRHRVFENFTK